MENDNQDLQGILDRLARIEQLLSSSTVREAYTIEQVAERLKHSAYQVREWCRNGQVPGVKKIAGRGRGEWRILHDVLLRLESRNRRANRSHIGAQNGPTEVQGFRTILP